MKSSGKKVHTTMKDALRDQKQDVVRDALYDAAVDLFARSGFDETTVEEVAQAAGVSRRTFFRYFDSKDDLLAYPVINYTKALADAVEACPVSYSSVQVMHETVFAGVRYTTAIESRTRQVIMISERSASARQAYQSRMMDVEDKLAAAFATRFHDASQNDLRPRLLAAVTLTVMHTSIISWFQGQHKDLGAAAKDVLGKIRSILCTDAPSAKRSSASDQSTNRQSSGTSTTRGRVSSKSRE